MDEEEQDECRQLYKKFCQWENIKESFYDWSVWQASWIEAKEHHKEKTSWALLRLAELEILLKNYQRTNGNIQQQVQADPASSQDSLT